MTAECTIDVPSLSPSPEEDLDTTSTSPTGLPSFTSTEQTIITTPSNHNSTRSFLLVLARTLRLRRTPELLAPILPLFSLLSARLLNLSRMPHPHKSVVWFELLHGLDGVVDEGEACRFAATVGSTQAEDIDLVLVGFVDGGELVTEVVLGDVCAVGVEDVTGSYVSQEPTNKVFAMNLGDEEDLLSRRRRFGDLHDHLLAGEQSVGDELASSDGDLRVSHNCGRIGIRRKSGCCRNGIVKLR
jgi:hypothetical protein